MCQNYWPACVTLLSNNPQQEHALLTPCIFYMENTNFSSNRWFTVSPFKHNRLKNSFIHQPHLLLNQNQCSAESELLVRILCDMFHAQCAFRNTYLVCNCSISHTYTWLWQSSQVYLATHLSIFYFYPRERIYHPWLVIYLTISPRFSPPFSCQSHMFCRKRKRWSLVLHPACEHTDCQATSPI